MDTPPAIDPNGRPPITDYPRTGPAPAPVLPRPGRWFTLRQMLPGDEFVLPGTGESLHLTRCDLPGELAPVNMALVSVEGLPLSLTLSLSQRFRMTRAPRSVAVACLVCGNGHEALTRYEYDLAIRPPVVCAICPRCDLITDGTVLAPTHPDELDGGSRDNA